MMTRPRRKSELRANSLLAKNVLLVSRVSEVPNYRNAKWGLESATGAEVTLHEKCLLQKRACGIDTDGLYLQTLTTGH